MSKSDHNEFEIQVNVNVEEVIKMYIDKKD